MTKSFLSSPLDFTRKLKISLVDAMPLHKMLLAQNLTVSGWPLLTKNGLRLWTLFAGSSLPPVANSTTIAMRLLIMSHNQCATKKIWTWGRKVRIGTRGQVETWGSDFVLSQCTAGTTHCIEATVSAYSVLSIRACDPDSVLSTHACHRF